MKMHVLLIPSIILMSTFLLSAQDNFQFSYSANGDEVIEWVIPSNDGNLILAGKTNSVDPSGDGLIMKTDAEGNIIWSKTIGGPGWDEIAPLQAQFTGAQPLDNSFYLLGIEPGVYTVELHFEPNRVLRRFIVL